MTGNAVANVAQAAISAALLFALYRFINNELGVEQLGVWSVVLATVSAGRIADLGLSGGVVRFVARALARNRQAHATRVVDTVAVALMASVGAVALVLYPVLARVLGLLFDADHLRAALELLPYSLIALWLVVVGTVFQGGLDGCQRMGLRATIILIGQTLLLVFAFVLVPRNGLIGLAWAQIAQGVFLVAAGRLALRGALPGMPVLPRNGSWSVLRDMLPYGANLQVSAVFMLLLDPIAKAMMARFGGAAAAGYFEMANQVVLKLRALITAGNQSIVPHVTSLSENAPERLEGLYRRNMRMLFYVSVPLFALLIAWGGGLSWLLIGGYERLFGWFLVILAIAWLLNIFANPAYFTNMGTGRVGRNTLAHVTMGLLNVALGVTLGGRFGSYGVAIAYAVAVVIGSGILIAVFHHGNGVRLREIVSSEDIGLVVVCASVAAYGVIVPLRFTGSETGMIAVGLLMPLVLIGVATWLHSMRLQIATLFIGWRTHIR